MTVPLEMEVTFHVTTSFSIMHVILKTTTRTRTLKGGGFGLRASPTMARPQLEKLWASLAMARSRPQKIWASPASY